jgi:VCBS repeat protein
MKRMFSTRDAARHRSVASCAGLGVAFLLSCALIGLVFVAKAAASHGDASGSAPPVVTQFTINDFDGDKRPDLASVRLGQNGSRNARYLIDFHLTSGLPQSIGITAPTGGLHLTSRDVNGDNYPDVIVTTYWTNQPVAVLLNDGRGNFTRSNPSAFSTGLASSESSRFARPDDIKDATAALFSRYVPGQCEACPVAVSCQVAAGRPVIDACLFAELSNSDSFFGRAPPSIALQR